MALVVHTSVGETSLKTWHMHTKTPRRVFLSFFFPFLPSFENMADRATKAEKIERAFFEWNYTLALLVWTQSLVGGGELLTWRVNYKIFTSLSVQY